MTRKVVGMAAEMLEAEAGPFRRIGVQRGHLERA